MLNETQEKIKGYLEAYDLILLAGTGDSGDGDLAGQLLNSQALHKSGKKVLVLPADECEGLEGLYYTYEFSDRIRVAGRSRLYGSLMNYVDLGLLTEQEMLEAVLQ